MEDWELDFDLTMKLTLTIHMILFIFVDLTLAMFSKFDIPALVSIIGIISSAFASTPVAKSIVNALTTLAPVPPIANIKSLGFDMIYCFKTPQYQRYC